LYGADLLGGSLACLALVPLLNLIGGPNTILVAGVVVALAGYFWAAARKRASSPIQAATGRSTGSWRWSCSRPASGAWPRDTGR